MLFKRMRYDSWRRRLFQREPSHEPESKKGTLNKEIRRSIALVQEVRGVIAREESELRQLEGFLDKEVDLHRNPEGSSPESVGE